MEGDGRPGESGPSLDGGAIYGQGPVTHGSAISPDRFDSPLYSHGVQPGPQRPRRPKLQHSQSILRKQAEEEAIKRSRSLSESYELSADLQDKQVFFKVALELVKLRIITAEMVRGEITDSFLGMKFSNLHVHHIWASKSVPTSIKAKIFVLQIHTPNLRPA